MLQFEYYYKKPYFYKKAKRAKRQKPKIRKGYGCKRERSRESLHSRDLSWTDGAVTYTTYDHRSPAPTLPLSTPEPSSGCSFHSVS